MSQPHSFPTFIVNTVFDSAVWVGILALAGVLYGAVFNTDKKITAQACAIRGVVTTIAFRIAVYTMGGPKGEKTKSFYMIDSIVSAILDTITILAFRKLNLIGTKGTILFGILAGLGALGGLSQVLSPKQDKVVQTSI